MDEEAAFLRAICESPDDDAPRLIFADWLEEHGQEERSDFIRVQVRLAREPRIFKSGSIVDLISGKIIQNAADAKEPCILKYDTENPAIDDLRFRERELWNLGTNSGGFLDVAPAAWGSIGWQRGFIESLKQITAADWLEHGDYILERHPVQEVALTTELDWHSPSASGILMLTAGDVERRCKTVYGAWDSSRNRRTVIDAILADEWPSIVFHQPRTRRPNPQLTARPRILTVA